MCVCARAFGEHLCLLTPAHMCVPWAIIAHAVFLDTYLCSSGIHMCVPHVRTCVL